MKKLYIVLLVVLAAAVAGGGAMLYYETHPIIETVDPAGELFPDGYCDRVFTEEFIDEFIYYMIEVQDDIKNDVDDSDDWEVWYYDPDEVASYEDGVITAVNAAGDIVDEFDINELLNIYCSGGEE